MIITEITNKFLKNITMDLAKETFELPFQVSKIIEIIKNIFEVIIFIGLIYLICIR